MSLGYAKGAQIKGMAKDIKTPWEWLSQCNEIRKLWFQRGMFN
jgi:hypothetical protein